MIRYKVDPIPVKYVGSSDIKEAHAYINKWTSELIDEKDKYL